MLAVANDGLRPTLPTWPSWSTAAPRRCTSLVVHAVRTQIWCILVVSGRQARGTDPGCWTFSRCCKPTACTSSRPATSGQKSNILVCSSNIASLSAVYAVHEHAHRATSFSAELVGRARDQAALEAYTKATALHSSDDSENDNTTRPSGLQTDLASAIETAVETWG